MDQDELHSWWWQMAEIAGIFVASFVASYVLYTFIRRFREATVKPRNPGHVWHPVPRRAYSRGAFDRPDGTRRKRDREIDIAGR